METKFIILLLVPLGLQLFGMSFAVLTDHYLQREHRRDMLLIAALLLCLVAQNLLEDHLMQGTRVFARTLTAIAGYSIRPLVLLLFLRIVSPQNSHWLGWLLVGINAAVHLTALFSPICFTITADNSFSRGPLGYTCHGISMLLLLNLMSLTIREYGHDRKQGLWIPLLNALLVVAAMAADTLLTVSLPISFLTVTMVSCCVFYYIWLHQQFVRRHERDLMAEQRIQIMMTQIQPHFLYNTLSTIQALCAIDPAKAVEITGKFSSYLRQNLNTLEFPGMISFEKELEHTRSYADIEMVRFPNIRVEYAIEDSGFSVPPLTVQPIVENAIRHGVRIREEGIIRVSAYQTEAGHEILISDNGVGFDVQTLGQNEGTHIGLKNVQERIETMCGGSVTVESRIDEGTRVTIFIPESEAGQ